MRKLLTLLIYILLAPVAFAETSLIPLPEVTIEEAKPQKEDLEEVLFEASAKILPLSELAKNPSVQPTPSLTAASPPSFSLRGMDPSQTRVFLEGVPLTEPVYHSDNLSLLPKLATPEVDLFSEALPASFLASSLGGGINLHLHEGIQRGKLLAQLGNLGVMSISHQSQISSGISLDLQYDQAKENFNYLDDNGTPFNEADDQQKERVHNSFRRFSLLPSYRSENQGRNKILIFSLNSFQVAEVPGPTNQPGPHQLRDWNSISSAQAKMVLSPNVLGETLVFFRFRGDTLQNESDKEDLSFNYTGGAKGLLEWKDSNWSSSFALGLNISKFQLDGQIEKRRQFTKARLEVPASITTRFNLGRSFEIKPAWLIALTDSEINSSPRFGFEVHPHPSVRLFGFIGAVFRSPSLSELYGNYLGVAESPNLKPEFAKKAEVGVAWSPGLGSQIVRSQVSITVFGARAENLISLTQIAPAVRRAENIGMASWLGQELALDLEHSWGFFFRPSFVYLWTRNESEIAAENGKSLPFRVPVSFRWETGVNRENWNLGHRASFYSASYLDKTNLEQLASYHLQDLYLGLKFKEAGQFELSIQNLFNITLASASLGGVEIQKYISGVSGYPAAGRRVGVTWIYDL